MANARENKIYSQRELREIMRETARETAKETVAETLRGLGVNVDNPLETQRDFLALHEWRTSIQAVRKKALITLVGVVVTGFVAFLWAVIRPRLLG